MVDGSGAEVTETRSSNCLKDTQLSAVLIPKKKSFCGLYVFGDDYNDDDDFDWSSTTTSVVVRCFHFGLFALDFGKYNNEISSYQRIHD